ncbi:MAG: DUF559 domain-containing protein [Flavobacteriales bacterium]|nr:DUF559 domain-containing protein [Flavobacteriales bacterium]
MSTTSASTALSKEEFQSILRIGIPNALPGLKQYDTSINHAPKRKDILSPDEKKLAVRNALRYFPQQFHATLAKEFFDELNSYGRIYMYRFRPDYEMLARPIDWYPARCQQAAAIMLMIQNNLDPRVAQHPHELITYGGNGAVFQNWAQYLLAMQYLSEMSDDQTLVMYSGHPLGLFPSHVDAPRVVVTNGMMIPNYSKQDDWEKYNALGVTQYGQMTAGSYMYIGSQGIVHGTTITVMNAARKMKSEKKLPDDHPVLFVTSGLGGMSGAQPKAANIAKVISVTAEVNPKAAHKRHKQGWVDEIFSDLNVLCARVKKAIAQNEIVSLAYIGNVLDMWEKFDAENIAVDLGTDQTSLHNPWAGGYYPAGLSYQESNDLMSNNPELFKQKVQESLRRHAAAINKHAAKGMYFFDYGNAFLLEASRAGGDVYLTPTLSKGVGEMNLTPNPSPKERGNNASAHWSTASDQEWEKKKPLAREFRRSPTKSESILWDALRNRKLNGIKFRRQHVVDYYIVDFISLEFDLVIEVDGDVHQRSDQAQHEEERSFYLQQKKFFKVIRFSNSEVENNLLKVLAEIRKSCDEQKLFIRTEMPNSSLSFGEGRGEVQAPLSIGRGIAGEVEFRYPSYVQDILGPMCFDYGFGPFRWVCCSGKPEDLQRTDVIALEVLEQLKRESPPEIQQQMSDNIQWIKEAAKNKLVVGSQARILYADANGRIEIAKAFNDAIAKGEIGPVVLGRDHHDVSGTDSPYRETSNIYDGSRFTADMAVQNFVGDAFRGATWVSLHNGGGVGWGEVINGGFGMLLEGTADSERRLKSMLHWDVNNGIARRAWARNKEAVFAAKRAMEQEPKLKMTIANQVDEDIIQNL